ncbi:MAG TPA: type IV pilus secretin PilQ [Polyangiaceae bacterium]|nr:type IV pilus secretin PilQ [Polyangiaceae bacterium]
MSVSSFRFGAVLSLAAAFAAFSTTPELWARANDVRSATHLAVDAEGEGGATVRVEFTRPPTYTVRVERGGLRLIVDVPNAELDRVPSAFTDRVGVLGGVLAQTFRQNGKSTARVLITLEALAEHRVAVEGNALVVRLAPKGSAAAKGSTAPVPGPSSDRSAVPRVEDVRFEPAEHDDRVLIELSEIVEFRAAPGAPGKARLELLGAELPESLERLLDVSAFQARVRSVATYRSDGRVVLEADLAPGVVADVERRGRDLVWSFAEQGKLPSSATGVAPDGKAARRSRTVHVEAPLQGVMDIQTGIAHGPIETEVAPDRAAGFNSGFFAQQRQYTGRRIDLDLKDADIHNVLRLLADVGQVNIVTSDSVSGSVTIRMRNVPWDQALDVVLQAKGLGLVRQANMIRVAPLAELEKEREMQIARRMQEVKLAPLETRLIPISYAQASSIQERAQPLLSERGTIAVDERTNVLIVRDIAGNLNQIEELARSLDTQTPQVLVEARIVEATSRYLRDVGIQWGGDATFSAATGNPTGVSFPNSIGIVGGASDSDTPTAGLSPFTAQVANPNFAVNLPAAVGAGSGGALGLTFGSIDNNFNLALRLSAAEASDMLRILSSPRILTLDNSEARISQGTLLPFSQVSAQGVQTTFQEAKLQLLVRPHVTADGSVSMRVKINRDEPDFNQTSADGEPTILKREAETDLLVMDGHTAVIGGIYTRNTGHNLDQVPFFGDIPLLGLLFQRRRASDTRSELVIFLTPRIVNRAEALGR